MAELNGNRLAPVTTGWTSQQTRAQFAAVAWLRWRILINGFRRKGGTGEMVGRILLYPIMAMFAVLPSVAVAVLAGLFTHQHHMGRIVWLLWGTFGYCQLLNIQLGQPGSTFDPTELIRFPLAVRNYIYIRLCFGLLSPANVIGTLMSACIAGGIIVIAPELWLYTLLALAVFAAANVLFSRMIFAWIDRWLATRRAREIFTGLIFFFSIGIQWANFTFNPAYSHSHHISPERLKLAADGSARIAPFLTWLPPEITTRSLIAAGHGSSTHYLLLTLASALYAAAFFAVFALRTRTEFRGENFTDSANAVSSKSLKPTATKVAMLNPADNRPTRTYGLSPVVFAQLGKEFLYVRRNTGILYGLLMPVFLVMIFASRFASRGSHASWVFPAAVGYSLLAIGTFSYNSFGLEGAGSQFYFLAPVRIGDVMFAKNLLIFLLALTEVLLMYLIITYMAGPPPFGYAVSAVLWAAATMLITTIFGNRRSITTPKKVATGRMANKQVSQLSALIGMGILLGSALLAAVPVGLSLYLDKDWFLIPIFAVYAAVAIYFYLRSLKTLDQFALEHREELFAELCKAS